MDRLLNGGFDEGARILVFGPSFQGKEVLARQVALTALKKKQGAIMVLTNETAGDCYRQMQKMDKGFSKHEEDGRIWFVDTYSRSIDAEEDQDHALYVDSPNDLNAIAVAINEAQGKLLEKAEQHVLVVDSASTLVLYNNAQATFRFLQVLLGRSRRAGGTAFVLLDDGMHQPAEVQMFNHAVDGAIQMRTDGSKNQLQAQGLNAKVGGWIDYEFSDTKTKLTGSLAAGRIK